MHTARLGGVVASAGVLATTIVVAGVLTPGYRPLVDAVSRLGSHDEPHASLLRAGLVLYGALVLTGAGALTRVTPGKERLLAFMIGTFGAASIVAGLAPKDPPGGTHTLISRIHVDADIVGGAMHPHGDGTSSRGSALRGRPPHRVVRARAHDPRRHRLSVHLGRGTVRAHRDRVAGDSLPTWLVVLAASTRRAEWNG